MSCAEGVSGTDILSQISAPCSAAHLQQPLDRGKKCDHEDLNKTVKARDSPVLYVL